MNIDKKSKIQHVFGTLNFKRAGSYGKKFSRLARKHFDKFASEISPSYENSMKSYPAFI